MSNSKFVEYTKLSPHYRTRTGKISKITIHHTAVVNATLEGLGNGFSGSRVASANYGIDVNGKVGLYVEEANRAITSSSTSNDNVAVTIEVMNDGGAPDWHVSDKSLSALIELCVDICKRNGINKLNFTGDTTGNLTMHKWFAATACPGPYLESKFPWIAEQVNKRLGATEEKVETKPTTSKVLYRVRKTWEDAASQIGAFADLSNAKNACDTAGSAYHVFDASGKAIYPIVVSISSLTVGDEVKLVSGAKYTNGKSVPNWVINSKLYVREIQGSNIVISTLKSGEVTGVVNEKYLIVTTPETFAVGDKVKLISGAKYTTGQKVPVWVTLRTLYVRELQGNNVVISTSKTGAVTGVISKEYLKKV